MCLIIFIGLIFWKDKSFLVNPIKSGHKSFGLLRSLIFVFVDRSVLKGLSVINCWDLSTSGEGPSWEWKTLGLKGLFLRAVSSNNFCVVLTDDLAKDES